MSTDSLSLSLLSVFSLISFFVVLITKNYSEKIGNQVLLDQDFDKPQAFHKEAVVRSGGLASIISLIIFFAMYHLLFDKILFDYIFLSLSIFFLGFWRILNSESEPKYRLLGMIIILTFFIIFFN